MGAKADDDDDGVGGCLSNYTVEVDQPRARRHKTVDLSTEVIGLDVKGFRISGHRQIGDRINARIDNAGRRLAIKNAPATERPPQS